MKQGTIALFLLETAHALMSGRDQLMIPKASELFMFIDLLDLTDHDRSALEKRGKELAIARRKKMEPYLKSLGLIDDSEEGSTH